MKKYSGNLLSYLNDQTKESIAAEKSKGSYTVQNIDVEKIIPNSRNFYGVRDIEALAATMALSGHISPLEVTPLDNGTYRLISGERRRAAVQLRLKRGEIENGEVPCIIRETFHDNDKLTAEQQEIINIISANDYRDKTPFEKLDEITELEPIARNFYETEKNNGYAENFRKFFAEKFLGVSIGTLQRTLALKKLVPEAREAFDAGLIKKTALAELAYKPEDVQREYLAKLKQGEVSGTIEDVQSEGRDDAESPASTPTENTAGEEDNENANVLPEENENITHDDAEEVSEAQEDNATREDDLPQEASNADKQENDNNGAELVATTENPKEKTPQASTKFPAMSPDEAQKEAENWVQTGICNMMLQAAEEAEKAKEEGDNLAAAQWDLRRAAANLILETIR